MWNTRSDNAEETAQFVVACGLFSSGRQCKEPFVEKETREVPVLPLKLVDARNTNSTPKRKSLHRNILAGVLKAWARKRGENSKQSECQCVQSYIGKKFTASIMHKQFARSYPSTFLAEHTFACALNHVHPLPNKRYHLSSWIRCDKSVCEALALTILETQVMSRILCLSPILKEDVWHLIYLRT